MSDEATLASALTVVMPVKNSGGLILNTLKDLNKICSDAGTKLGVLVVDDGSTDRTGFEVERNTRDFFIKVEVLFQTHQGRFEARLAGAKAASTEWILLLDSRVSLPLHSLMVILERVTRDSRPIDAVNSHVVFKSDSPVYSYIWEFITGIFWNMKWVINQEKFLIEPRNFYKVPKGTTCLLVRRNVFIEVAEQVKESVPNTTDVNDDTLLLGRFVEKYSLLYDLEQVAVYDPPRGIRKFFAHTFGRGMRSVYNTQLRSWPALAQVLSIPVLIVCLVFLLATSMVYSALPLAFILAGFFLLFTISTVSIGLVRGVKWRGITAAAIFGGPFILVYLLGQCWSGARIYLRKKVVGRRPI